MSLSDMTRTHTGGGGRALGVPELGEDHRVVPVSGEAS